jgi:hypothetical protein
VPEKTAYLKASLQIKCLIKRRQAKKDKNI